MGRKRTRSKLNLHSRWRGNKSGNHCQFCKLKNACRKRAEDNLALDKMGVCGSSFPWPRTSQRFCLNFVVDFWANDIKAYALNQATDGHPIPGYKLVEGRSVRKFSDESSRESSCSGSWIWPLWEESYSEIWGQTPWQRKLLMTYLVVLSLNQVVNQHSFQLTIAVKRWTLAKHEFKEE